MSLKTFHIFFLVIAILFDFGFAAYALFGEETAISKDLRVMGVGSGVFGLLLLAYGIWFVRRKAPAIIV